MLHLESLISTVPRGYHGIDRDREKCEYNRKCPGELAWVNNGTANVISGWGAWY